jgi:uncharacterized membrane protein
MRFRKWTLVFFVTYAALEAVFVAVVGLALKIPARSLLGPYVTLLFSVILLAPCVRWVLQFRKEAKSCAIRFALVVFVYLQLFSFILAFNAVNLGIVSEAVIVDDSAPVAVVGSIMMSVGVYITVRRRLEASNNRPAATG